MDLQCLLGLSFPTYSTTLHVGPGRGSLAILSGDHSVQLNPNNGKGVTLAVTRSDPLWLTCDSELSGRTHEGVRARKADKGVLQY